MPDDGIWTANFSPDGKRLLTTSTDHIARVWDALTGDLIAATPKFQVGLEYKTNADFLPDGSGFFVVATDHDTAVQVWDSAPASPRSELIRQNGEVESVHVSPDGRLLAIATDDELARVWNIASAYEVIPPIPLRSESELVRFDPSGQFLLTVTGNEVRIWDLAIPASAEPLLRHAAGVTRARFSSDGKRVVTASFDGTARVWSTQSGEPVSNRLRHSGHEKSDQGNAVMDAVFSPDGQRVATASWDHTAMIWDASTGKAETVPMRHRYGIERVSFSPNGDRVVTGGADDSGEDEYEARVWDARTGAPITKRIIFTDYVRSVAFTPDGTKIFTAGYDEQAQLWHATDGTE